MKFKEIVLEKVEKLNESISITKTNMEKHTVTPEQVYKSLSVMQVELERIKALITRE